MDILFSLCLGLGLSAACGFRVFVPLLVLSAAARFGHVALADGFSWLGSDTALVVFGAATLLEILGYYIPWFDNLLDTAASPAAVIAGTVMTASVLIDVSPLVQWTLALIAGGGVAGVFQGSTTAARLASTTTTAGLGNPLISTIEAAVSTVLSLVAVVVPIAAACLVLALVFWVLRVYRRWRGRTQTIAE